MTTLQTIETKVARILEAFGCSGEEPAEAQEPAGDDALLNGPQLPTAAMPQEEIDRLLASFD